MSDVKPLESLISALEDPDPNVRLAAVETAGGLKDPWVVELPASALIDEEPRVRRATARALGEIKDACAVDPLVATLTDEDPSVREAAVRALGRIGDYRAPLAARDVAKYALGRDFVVRYQDPRVDGLMAALRDDKRKVRSAAAQALAEIGDPRAVQLLVAAALKDEDTDVRSAAADTLKQIGDLRAWSCSSPHWRTRTLRSERRRGSLGRSRTLGRSG